MRKFTKVITAVATATAVGFAASPAGAAPATQEQEAKAEGLKAIVEQLTTAYESLTGPVKVTRDGKTKVLSVTYTNGSDKPQLCSGLALPYSEVKAEGLDQKGADEDREKTLKAFDTILGKGGSAVFGADAAGKPISAEGQAAAEQVFDLGLQAAVGGGVAVKPKESVTWTMKLPEKQATGIVMCDGNILTGQKQKVNKGIEQDVLFDSVKEKLGSAGSVVDGSSKNPTAAGSFISSIPFLTKILEFLSGIFDFFKNLFNPKGEGSSSAKGSSDQKAPADKEAADKAPTEKDPAGK